MGAVLLLLFVALQLPPRDAPSRDAAAQPGTASVSGRVAAAASGAPIAGAMVVLAPAQNADNSVRRLPSREDGARVGSITDAAGRFRITGVNAGSYRVVATPPGYSGRYLAAGYGAAHGNDAGKPIAVAHGADLRNVDIVLPPSLAIEGRVVDEAGEPLARVSVFAARIMAGSDRPQRAPAPPATTDDLGRYRVYGLEAGEYIVGVESSGFVSVSASEWIDARTVSASFRGTPINLVTTFHPSSATESSAQRVRLTGPNDLAGIDVAMLRTRRFLVEGMVSDSQGTPANNTNGVLIRSGFSGTNTRPFRTDSEGRFAAGALEPGDYRLLIGPGLLPGLHSVNGRTEFADLALSVASDLSGATVVTQPGIGLSGRVVFSEGSPARLPAMTIAFRRPETEPGVGEIVATTDDEFRFYGSDVFGLQLIRVTGLAPGWAVKAVTLHGNDITDVATVFKAADDAEVHIQLTARPSTVEGQVRAEGAVPAPAATVYVFAEDRASWSMSSPRTRFVDTGTDGRFSVTGLGGGRYYAIAIAREGFRMPPAPGLAFFDLLSKEATPFVVSDDERRTLDLRLWRWPE